MPAAGVAPATAARRATTLERAHTLLYCGLWVVLGVSAALFASRFVTGEGAWSTFAIWYLALLTASTGWLFGLLLVHDLRPRRYPRYGGERIAVVIPCYNEDPELVERSIRTVIEGEGDTQVIVIDDGSTNDVYARLAALRDELGFALHAFERNRGKREALHYAVTHLLDDEAAFVVTIDSDTVLERDALVRVVEPLLDPRIGASTGNVLLLNERQNALTRVIGTYYWIGLNMYKRAQSVIRSVVCCSGCLAAYQAPLLREIIDEFAGQRFLGEPCTHSEDRHLTNLVLRRGLDVVYVEEAVSWTETPATLRGFLRQQRRWKRGYVRESLYTLLHAWRHKPLLFAQVALWDLTAPFLSFGLRLALIVTVVEHPHLVLTAIVPGWLALALMRYVFVPLRAPRKLPGLLGYVVFYELCLYWLNIWALITVRNSSWMTRSTSSQF